MSLPTIKVEIAFNAGVTTPAASRTWTDVTQWVLLGSGIEIEHGRGDWRSTADANSLRLTLNNSDGRFTAGLASSPYYPNVKIGRPIRVTATLGGVASTRFVGFIDEWPVEWPATVGTFATAAITATSRLAWLGNRVELRSIIEQEYLLDEPAEHYTMGEAAGATSVGDTSGNGLAPLSMVGTGTSVVFGNATGPGTDGLTAAQFTDGGKSLRLSGNPSPLAVGATIFGLEADFSGTTVGGSGALLADAVNAQLGVDNTGVVFFQTMSAGVASPSTYLDGGTHTAFGYVSGSTIALYVDGLLVDTDTTGSAMTIYPIVGIGTAGAIGSIILGLTNSALTGAVAHVAQYVNAVPSPTRITAHANAALTGFAGETPAARLTRYASYAAIAATELSLETGMVPDLAHIDTTGRTAVDCMRTVEATEEGVLHDGRDGLLTFHARNHRYSAASAFTLNVPTGQVDVGISPRLDRSAMRNDVSAQSTDGTVTARALNQPSIDDYGPARESLDLATTNDEEPFQHASWIVNSYGDPQPRVPQLGVKLANVPESTAQAILESGVGTRCTVTGMPSQAEQSTQGYFIEGYGERIGAGYHDFTFNVSQAEPFDVWTVEDPVYGQYDAYGLAY